MCVILRFYKFYLFTYASWLPYKQASGGFFITNAYHQIMVAGCSKIIAENPFDTELAVSR